MVCYSKDLDYARTEDTPMGTTFDALRAAGQRVGGMPIGRYLWHRWGLWLKDVGGDWDTVGVCSYGGAWV